MMITYVSPLRLVQVYTRIVKQNYSTVNTTPETLGKAYIDPPEK